MTTYVVLQLVESEEHGGTWLNMANVQATSEKGAIRAAVEESGTYIAVPARSWKPRTVTVETSPRVKLS